MVPHPRTYKARYAGAHLAFVCSFILVGLIMFLFTPLTYNLDEIKVTFLYCGGPLLVSLYLYLLMRGEVNPLPKIALVPFGLYFMVMLVSTALAAHHWIGWIDMGYQIAVFGPFLCLAGSLREQKMVVRALWIYVVFAFATAVFGLLHYGGLFILLHNFLYFGHPPSTMDSGLHSLIFTLEHSRDMISTILNRDFFGSFLVIFIPLAMAGAFVFPTAGRRLFSAIAGLLMVLCLYLAFSKDSAGAFFLSVLVFALLYHKYESAKKVNIPHLHVWAIGCLILAVTLVFFTRGVLAEKLKGIAFTIASRKIIWGGSIGIFTESLRTVLMGGGPGSFRLLFPKYRSPDYHLWDISNVTLYSHNRYLDLLAETGIFGFILYMWFLVIIFYFGFKLIRECQNSTLRVCQIGLLSSLFGLLVTNFFSPNARWAVVGVNYWGVLGLSLGCYIFWQQAEGGAAGKQRLAVAQKSLTVLALLVASLLVTTVSIVYGIRYFLGAYYNKQGLDYTMAEEYPLAITDFRKALEYNPTFITTYYKRAHAYNKNDQEALALKTYQDLTKYAPDYSEIHYNLGVMYNALGNKAEAFKEFVRAAEMSNKVNIQFTLAQLYQQNHLYEKAKEVLMKMPQFKRDPRDEQMTPEIEADMKLRAKEQLVKVAAYLGDYALAEKTQEELYRQNPGNPRYILDMVNIYKVTKNYDKAYEFLKQALQNNPLDTASRVQMFNLLMQLGRYKEALEHLEVLEKLQPNNQEIMYRLGQTYSKLDNPEKATSYFQKTIELDSSSSFGISARRALKALPK
jgi:tetratricopeptide (TPR) repeat protein/O-antigen ligase